MKIFVVAALHGDEPFGLKIIGRLNTANGQHTGTPKTIMTRIGHPEAVAKGKRYLEEDLNRSFHKSVPSVETTIANAIEKEIQQFEPDVIIDIHTSISDIGNIAIAARHCPQTVNLAQQLGMEALVIMPKELTDTSLIGRFPDRAISLEFGRNRRSNKLAREVAALIENLERHYPETVQQLPVFEVQGYIDKNFKGLSDIKNLVFHEELNGHPFLAGTNTYETFGGFLAQKIA